MIYIFSTKIFILKYFLDFQILISEPSCSIRFFLKKSLIKSQFFFLVIY